MSDLVDDIPEISNRELIHWLNNKYARHGEIEDGVAARRIESQQAEIERLKDKLDRINQWCRAYPRTVFIEPTKEQWKRANEVLDDHDDCPSLTAISGSNMRHVVEGIQEIAALEQAND